MTEQIPLQFEFQSNQRFNTFYSGVNKEVITHLQQFSINKEKGQQVFIWGTAGTGKTHLLQASIQETNKQDKSTFYFSFNNNKLSSPSILEGLEHLDFVCFDNIDQIAGNTVWEQAFFDFFNLHRDNNKQLLLSASCPPEFLTIELPDLKTRMSWGLTLKLNPLTEEQQLKALIYRANNLGFEIPTQVGQFLISRYASDLPSIWKLLDKIDKETLAAKCKITVPFVKQIMTHQESNESR